MAPLNKMDTLGTSRCSKKKKSQVWKSRGWSSSGGGLAASIQAELKQNVFPYPKGYTMGRTLYLYMNGVTRWGILPQPRVDQIP